MPTAFHIGFPVHCGPIQRLAFSFDGGFALCFTLLAAHDFDAAHILLNLMHTMIQMIIIVIKNLKRIATFLLWPRLIMVLLQRLYLKPFLPILY